MSKPKTKKNVEQEKKEKIALKPKAKKKAGGQGKRKGSAFEREIAKKLSLWFSEGEREDIFYRSHNSGGRFTARQKSQKDTAYQSGDITCSDPLGEHLISKWSIECKSGYGNWGVLDFVDSRQYITKLESFFQQCCEDAHKANKEPILIFRRKGKKTCICLAKEYINHLEAFNGKLEKIHVEVHSQWMPVVIIGFDDFLNWITSPQTI